MQQCSHETINTKFQVMPIKLRLLLFYLNHFVKEMDYLNMTAEEVRQINRRELKKVDRLVDFPPTPMFEVKNQTIPMRDGAQIPIRIYYPSDKKKLPVIVFYHGGGFVTRNLDSHDLACRRIAKTNQAVVVSIGYRLAPEYKFPTPVEDCYDATVWVANHVQELGVNGEKLVVMGDSAGGNLATVICILARNLKGPKIAAQVLIYPTTDARLSQPSIDRFGKGYFLTRKKMQWFLDHYKRDDADIMNPLMSPLLEKDLSNLPPAFVTTASFDPLKDEGEAYAKRLKEAGNAVTFKEYKGMVHGFLNLAKITTKGTMGMNQDIQQFLRSLDILV